MSEIFHLFMYKYIYIPTHHKQIPNMPKTFTYLTVWQIGKSFRKILMIRDKHKNFDSSRGVKGNEVNKEI